MLSLEGAQAGLSLNGILRKRLAYRTLGGHHSGERPWSAQK